MLQKKKLIEFYIEQYAREARRKQRKPMRANDALNRLTNLERIFRSARSSGVNIHTLEE